MKRCTVVVLAAFALCAAPQTADAEISDELAKELSGYVETSMSDGGTAAKRAALLTWGLVADVDEREKIAERKSSRKERIRLAAGLALWATEGRKESKGDAEEQEEKEAGEKGSDTNDAEAFVLEQLASRSNLYDVLRREVSLLPDRRESELLRRIIEEGKARQQKAVFRYLAQQRGPLYELLGEYLESNNGGVRTRALTAAAATARPAALDIVESRMLSASKKAIQSDGIELAIRISELPGRREAVVDTLETALEHDNSSVVQRAAVRLLELKNTSGVEPLLDLLEEVGSLERRKEIARALLENEVAPPPERAKQLYLSVAGPEKPGEKEKSGPEHDEQLQELYLELAVASGDDGMFARVEKMFGSTRFRERLSAAKAFGHTNRDAAVDMLGKALFEGTPKMRLVAAKSLRRIGSKAALPALKRSISQERNKKIKLQVIGALGEIGTPAALRILRFNSRARDREIRKAIISAVRTAGRKEGVETLRLYFSARDRELQWKTFVALLDIAPKQAMEQMSGVFRNPPDGFIRDLERLPRERQSFIYPKLIDHDNGRVRSETFESARRIGEPMHGLLRNVAFENVGREDVQKRAVRYFSEIRTADDRPRFEKLVREAESEELRRLAAWTITEYEDADLEATFRGYVTRSEPFLKAVGAYGIARIYSQNPDAAADETAEK